MSEMGRLSREDSRISEIELYGELKKGKAVKGIPRGVGGEHV